MAKNRNLNAAAKAKKDEFYTQHTDIEHELQHYWAHFADKVVLCNCDDPFESQLQAHPFKAICLNLSTTLSPRTR